MLVSFGRVLFSLDDVTAATKLEDEHAEGVTDAAYQFFRRMTGVVIEDGE